jgi:DNA-binding LacI/PurR family transcriptional regulator
MTRLKDIALRAGVSVMTVSKALRDEPDVSEATKARLKLLAQQMGYVPDSTAQGLRTRTSKLIGLAVSSVTNPVFARVVLAIEERVHEMGYDLLLAHTFNTPEREESCLRHFLARRVDGLLIAPVYRMTNDAPVYQELLARRIPTVVLGPPASFCSQFPNVQTDDLLAGYAVTRHLIQLGHRRIAFLGGPPGTPWSQERFEGYRQALREAGTNGDDKLVFQAGRNIEDGAKAAAQMIAEASDATAIQAVNDHVAIGCADALMRQGLEIPRDISIAGFGNTLLGEYFRAPLTTTRQPKYRLGQAAMDALQQLMSGHLPENKRLPAEIILRSSTAAAPATAPLRHLKPASSPPAPTPPKI